MTVEELRQNKLELLGKLVAGLGHEVRNPLSAIKLNLDYMEMFSDELAPDIIDSINSSKDALQRIENLIETILSFARTKNEEEEIFLERIVKSAVDLSSIKARSKEVKLITEIGEETARILYKPSKLLQIVLNLISNAIESCENGGEVKVGTLINEENGYTVLYVEDSGCGIPYEKQKFIFDEFFTTKEEGTGLGLYVCKYLLEKYNGKISVESEPGKGSKFILEIPGGK